MNLGGKSGTPRLGMTEFVSAVRYRIAEYRAVRAARNAPPATPEPCAECGATVQPGEGFWFPFWRAVTCSDDCSDHFYAAMH